MELSVKSEFHPTEDRKKVLRAVENLFPSLEFKEKAGSFMGEGADRNDLAAFKELLKLQQIRATARTFLERRAEDDKLEFQLNKQAAFAGKVNFVDFDIALGPIEVRIKDKDLAGLVDWLCS